MKFSPCKQRKLLPKVHAKTYLLTACNSKSTSVKKKCVEFSTFKNEHKS